MSSSSENITPDTGNIDRERRWDLIDTKGATLWFTGLSGSGKSTVAGALELALLQQGVLCYRLDGDNLRFGLCGNLGFSAEDRTENIRRAGEVAKLFSDSGMLTLCTFISPYRRDRDQLRQIHRAAGLEFIEVHVNAPLDVCEQRDPKGLYKKARDGQITGFTGIDDPYEAPESPEIALETASHSVPECVEQIVAFLGRRGLLKQS